ncbi:MAG: hypothetical protein EPO07_08620 [Verrucomicrobia bacterium]|nr:MAG: hypothetical protein EPO07_08620 [Verrucomicrobiota bacterium]
MKTLMVDNYRRVRLPNAKPRTKLAFEDHGDGTMTLTVIKAVVAEPFPRGSLLRYLTPQRDKKQLAMLEGCLQTPE